MKCRTCGKSIVVFCEPSGGVYVLEKPYKGFTESHYCGTYKEMFSKYMIKKLGLEDNEL